MSEEKKQEEEVVIINSEQQIQFEYKTVRVGGRTYQVKRPIIPDNEDFPKRHRFTKKKGPGRPKKNVEPKTKLDELLELDPQDALEQNIDLNS